MSRKESSVSEIVCKLKSRMNAETFREQLKPKKDTFVHYFLLTIPLLIKVPRSSSEFFLNYLCWPARKGNALSRNENQYSMSK